MLEKWPMVSVVVVNFNGISHLEKCLAHLMQTNYPNFEVIVVDCLTKNIESWIKQHFPKVKVVHYDYDIGSSASHNVEKHVTPESKYLAFLDNDSYVTENWLRELVKVMENDEEIGIAQAKLLVTFNGKLMDNAGLAIDFLGTWYSTRGLKSEDFKEMMELFAASSAGCLVRMDVFKKAGGFDPEYFIYDDDTDFSFRTRLLGYKIVLVPSATVLHNGDPVKALNPRKLKHSIKNRVYTMIKNYELKNLLWRFSIYYLLTFSAGIGFAAAGRSLEAKETFRGLFHPLLNFKDAVQKRAIVQSSRKVRDSELFRLGFLRNDIRPTIMEFKLRAKQILNNSFNNH
ncbi:MAG: glycosyltransferase family 2 protein [Candidatus Bathyarchaeia archaeon]